MGGTDKIVPVDVYIPGCPPTPAATLYGFAMALGLLEQKFMPVYRASRMTKRRKFSTPAWCSRVCVSTAKRVAAASYRYGRQIADDYMRLLAQGDSQVVRWLEAEKIRV